MQYIPVGISVICLRLTKKKEHKFQYQKEEKHLS